MPVQRAASVAAASKPRRPAAPRPPLSGTDEGAVIRSAVCAAAQIIPLFCMNAKKAAGVAETHAAKAIAEKTGGRPTDKDFTTNLAKAIVRHLPESAALCCAALCCAALRCAALRCAVLRCAAVRRSCRCGVRF